MPGNTAVEDENAQLRKKVHHLEQRNNALRHNLRHQDGVISRLQMRSAPKTAMHKAQYLEKEVEELKKQCEWQELERVRAQRRMLAFQSETVALRGLVSFVEHPELASLCKIESEKTLLSEQVQSMQRELDRTREELNNWKALAAESTALAEKYRARNATLEHAAEEDPSSAVSSSQDTKPLRGNSLPSRRHVHDEQTPTSSLAQSKASCAADVESLLLDRSTAPTTDHAIIGGQTEKELGSRNESILPARSSGGDDAAKSGTSLAAAGDASALPLTALQQKLKRLQKIAFLQRQENTLISSRFASVTKANRLLMERMDALERENFQLRSNQEDV